MKMGIKEFRERLGEVATGEDPIAVTHHGRIVGHYLPVDGPRVQGAELDDWLAARERFRQHWQASTPDWEARLSRMGWDDEGEPYANDPRR